MSESDSDEFYDAQDVTPTGTSVTVSRCETQGSDDNIEEVASLSCIEREKQMLLEQKKTVEDRMRQEEEVIQQRLEALELKQMKEQQKQEMARKAIEIEHRRKKLEGVREIIAQESTPVHSPTATVPPETKDIHLTAEQQLEEQLEALSFELERSGKCTAVPCSKGSSSSDGLEANRKEDFIEDANHFISMKSHRFEGHSLDHMISGLNSNINYCFNKSSSLNGNLNRHEQSVKKVTCKQLEDLMTPDPVQPKCSSLPVQLSAYPCDGSRHESAMYQEPDIIQSTKSLSWQQPVTSTPITDEPHGTESAGDMMTDICQLQEGDGDMGGGDTPVAPPRKKKSTKSCESLPSAIKVCPTTNRLDISDDVDDDTHPTLDLCSAIQGNCHVTAMDDAEAKGLEELDLEVPCDADAISQGASSTQSEDNVEVRAEKEAKEQNTETSVPSTSDLCLARTKSKTLAGSPVHAITTKPPAAKVLTDKEILEQVMVTNLDTGEKLPLSLAEEKVPKTTNPLALHIMRRTKEYSSESPMQKGKESTGKGPKEQGKTVKTIRLPKKRGKRIKKFLSKSVRKIKSELKSVKDDMFHGENSSSDEDEFVDGRRMIKIKASHSHKGPYDFDLLVPVQNLVEDSNAAVWTMKFSHCGKLLATGGQDNILRVWVLKSWYTYFDGMRQKYSEAASMMSTQPDISANNTEEEDHHAPFMRKPFCVFRGHTADLLDVSWSKNYFILSSSMDKTVRLWHVSRSECLCCFQHIDFVTAIAFHPKDDRYFLSGSLDGKLRLWSIPEKKVALWNEVSGQSKLITSANFCSDGKIAVGTYDGRCVLYTADHLDYHTQIHVRSTRGKNAKGGKVTGVEPYPGENKILVTSNDSRIRLYDLRDKTLTCKYKGTINSSSRIKAVFNHDGRYIICGSEDGCVYIWKTQHDFYKFYSVRRDRNDFWEGVKAHVAVVTAAIFAPCPNLIIRPQFEYMDSEDRQTPGVRGEVIISADINGAIKVFINKFKPGSG